MPTHTNAGDRTPTHTPDLEDYLTPTSPFACANHLTLADCTTLCHAIDGALDAMRRAVGTPLAIDSFAYA